MLSIVAAWAAVPMASAWAAWEDDEYKIQRAFYGSPQKHVDVTQQLRDLAQQDTRFRLSNKTFGVDPDRGRVKTLRIIATDGRGRSRTFEYTEGSWVDGAQFSGWGSGGWGQGGGSNDGWNNKPGYHDGRDGGYRILRARYGTAQNHIDVTQRLRELARRDERFRLSNATFGTDPDKGRPKTLRIFARGPNGQRRIFEYPEHSWIDGAQFSGWGGGDWGQDDNDNDWGGDRPEFGGDGGGSLDDRLRIVRAEYGAGNRKWDVTARMQQRVHNGRLSLKVSNEAAGGDPADGQPKQLWITYSIDGRHLRRIVPEGDFLSLP
jgi:hypothetical protein